jgi:flagellin-like protein
MHRAISPLLGTIILIAITVGAGLVIYNLFFSTAGTLSAQLNIQVVSIDIVKTSSQTLVSATIKNTGNKPITSCTVYVYGDSGTATLSLGSIEVGQTKSANVRNPSGFSVTAGKSYPVRIVVTASDGSTLDKSMSVTCTS